MASAYTSASPATFSTFRPTRSSTVAGTAGPFDTLRITYGYTHNPASQIETRTRSNDAYAWTGGVDVNRGHVANGLNQYSRTTNSSGATITSFGYDANGNLTTSDPASSSGVTTTYTYDVENRLMAASGGRTIALRYDPLGRLYRSEGASGIRYYYWDGDALAIEYNDAGSAAASYVHGTSSGDDPLLWRGGGEYRRIRTDHQGSVIAVTNDAGTPVYTNAYDEWGIPNTTNNVPANTGRFQYTGQIWIAELGMYHYKARIYSPTLGRFLQVDPVGYDDQVNLYTYVANDPINSVDPEGTRDCAIRTGGLTCEPTASRTIVEDNGDEIRRTTITYFRRDGFVINVHTTSEGIGESWADPLVLVGGIATAVRSGVARLLGRGAEGAAAGGGALVGSTAFTVAETRGMTALFGQAEQGASNFLQNVVRGSVTGLPEGVTRSTLERYIIAVISSGPRVSGRPVHQMRVQGILKLLERTR